FHKPYKFSLNVDGGSNVNTQSVSTLYTEAPTSSDNILITSTILVTFTLDTRLTTPYTHDGLGVVVCDVHEDVCNSVSHLSGAVTESAGWQPVGYNNVPT